MIRTCAVDPEPVAAAGSDRPGPGRREADLATTVENLRQLTDNLRDLTEDAKRYPANVILGAPPRPLEGR